jgi:hypothetical protein
MAKVFEIDQMRAGVSQSDQAQAERHALEKSLKPFNPEGTPYDKESVIKEAQFFLYHHANTGYEFGKRLVLLKEHESAQLVAQIIEERFRISLRTAQFYEFIARLCAQSEKFRVVFDRLGMRSKGAALMAGLTDPEVQAALLEFEETGKLLGLDEAELYARSRKDLIKENRKLRALRDKKYEALEKENDNLTAHIEALQAQRLVPGLEKAQKLLKAGKGKLMDALHSLAQADFGLLATDAGSVAVIRMAIDEGRRILDELERQAFPAGVG